MVATPAAIPVTTPVPLTDAIVPEPLVQLPPEVASDKESAVPAQMMPDAGVMAAGAVFTVTEDVAEQEPTV